MTPHRAVTRMSMSWCFLFRPSRRGSGRSWKKGTIDTDGAWDTTGHPRGSSGAAWERHFTANPSIPDCPFAPPGQIAQDSAIALIVSRDVATGAVVAPSCGPTRTEADFVAHLRGVVATDPEAVRWHVVTDNLNT